MKALTICQPYAWLITLPVSDPRHKRCENRRWPTSYRGPLLIHAGKSRDWLDTWDDISWEESAAMVYGAIVGKTELVDCVTLNEVRNRLFDDRMKPTQHAEGPWCWILGEVVPIPPIYCPGKLGLWDYHGQVSGGWK